MRLSEHVLAKPKGNPSSPTPLDSSKPPEYVSPSPRCRAPKFPQGRGFAFQNLGVAESSDHVGACRGCHGYRYELICCAHCTKVSAGSHSDMPTTTSLSVQELKLDLKNFRTIPQPSEASAISALVSINPDWFWALTESLLTDGYHLTENILVLAGGKSGTDMEVKEGNRRIAALKLIYGYARRSLVTVPAHLEAMIAA